MSSLPCPAYRVLRLLAGKWKPAILFHLRAQTLRFGDLRRSLPEVSQMARTASVSAGVKGRICMGVSSGIITRGAW